MALGSSYVCVGRYLTKGTSRARVCSPSFGGLYRINYTPDIIYQTYGKEFSVPAGLAGVPASQVGTIMPNRYITQWTGLWGADRDNKTAIMRALSGLCFQVEDLVLKSPNAVKLIYAAAQDSGIMNNDFYNHWWRIFLAGGGAGFQLEKQYNYKKSSSDDPIFRYGPYLGKYVSVNHWVPVTYDDVTKEIKLSGAQSNLQMTNGTPYKHPVVDYGERLGGRGLLAGNVNNYYDRGNLWASGWADHINQNYAWGQTVNYEVFPGTGFTTKEAARSAISNHTNSLSDTNSYI